MSKKIMTSKGIKGVQLKMNEGIIQKIRPFFDLGYPARKTFRQKVDVKGNSIKMPTLKTVIRYFGIWKNEHTYTIREDLAKHQREIKAALIDQYEEIIIECKKYYEDSKTFVEDYKSDPDTLEMPYLTAIRQLTDHNTLIGELLATKARLKMAPFIDQTSEDAIKKKLEHEVEQQAIEIQKKKMNKTDKP